MAPPFVTELDEIDTLVAKLTAALDKTAAHFGVS